MLIATGRLQVFLLYCMSLSMRQSLCDDYYLLWKIGIVVDERTADTFSIAKAWDIPWCHYIYIHILTCCIDEVLLTVVESCMNDDDIK